MNGDGELSRGEAHIAAICAMIGETLGIHDVTADEDFIELGGTSLQGATLLAQIDRRLGTRLSLADLYEGPTAAGLAARLDTEIPAVGTHRPISTVWLTPPQSGLATAPVFLVNFHAGLAREIGRRRPVMVLSYGVAARDDTGWPPPTGVEALAAHYVAELRAAWPTGPYHLVGHCARGVAVTWEVARQLEQSGAEIGILSLIDGRPNRRVGWRRTLRNATSMPPRLLTLILVRGVLYRMLRALAIVETAGSDPPSVWERSDQTSRLKLIDLRLADYRMPTLTAKPLLIEPTKTIPRLRTEPVPITPSDDHHGLCPNGHVLIQLPGDHHALFDAPLLQRVAAAIEDTIQAHGR